jgi:hypothetical protein
MMFQGKTTIETNSKNTNVGMMGVRANLEDAIMNVNDRVWIFGGKAKEESSTFLWTEDHVMGITPWYN